MNGPLDRSALCALGVLRRRARRIDRGRRRIADDAAADTVVRYPPHHGGWHGLALRRRYEKRRHARPRLHSHRRLANCRAAGERQCADDDPYSPRPHAFRLEQRRCGAPHLARARCGPAGHGSGAGLSRPTARLFWCPLSGTGSSPDPRPDDRHRRRSRRARFDIVSRRRRARRNRADHPLPAPFHTPYHRLRYRACRPADLDRRDWPLADRLRRHGHSRIAADRLDPRYRGRQLVYNSRSRSGAAVDPSRGSVRRRWSARD